MRCLLLAVVVAVVASAGCDNWQEVGTLAKVESVDYLPASFGSAGTTIIRCEDGSTIPINGIHAVPIGKRVRIWRDYRLYKIEVIE